MAASSPTTPRPPAKRRRLRAHHDLETSPPPRPSPGPTTADVRMDNDTDGDTDSDESQSTVRAASPSTSSLLHPSRYHRHAALSRLQMLLSDELLLRILSHLGPNDLVSLSYTCSHLHRLSREPTLWRNLFAASFLHAPGASHVGLHPEAASQSSASAGSRRVAAPRGAAAAAATASTTTPLLDLTLSPRSFPTHYRIARPSLLPQLLRRHPRRLGPAPSSSAQSHLLTSPPQPPIPLPPHPLATMAAAPSHAARAASPAPSHLTTSTEAAHLTALYTDLRSEDEDERQGRLWDWKRLFGTEVNWRNGRYGVVPLPNAAAVASVGRASVPEAASRPQEGWRRTWPRDVGCVDGDGGSASGVAPGPTRSTSTTDDAAPRRRRQTSATVAAAATTTPTRGLPWRPRTLVATSPSLLVVASRERVDLLSEMPAEDALRRFDGVGDGEAERQIAEFEERLIALLPGLAIYSADPSRHVAGQPLHPPTPPPRGAGARGRAGGEQEQEQEQQRGGIQASRRLLLRRASFPRLAAWLLAPGERSGAVRARLRRGEGLGIEVVAVDGEGEIEEGEGAVDEQSEDESVGHGDASSSTASQGGGEATRSRRSSSTRTASPSPSPSSVASVGPSRSESGGHGAVARKGGPGQKRLMVAVCWSTGHTSLLRLRFRGTPRTLGHGSDGGSRSDGGDEAHHATHSDVTCDEVLLIPPCLPRPTAADGSVASPVLAALHDELLVTCDERFRISLSRIARRRRCRFRRRSGRTWTDDDVDGGDDEQWEFEPLRQLRSHVSHWPAHLHLSQVARTDCGPHPRTSLAEQGAAPSSASTTEATPASGAKTTYQLVVAYCTPLYPRRWTVGAQMMRIHLDGESEGVDAGGGGLDGVVPPTLPPTTTTSRGLGGSRGCDIESYHATAMRSYRRSTLEGAEPGTGHRLGRRSGGGVAREPTEVPSAAAAAADGVPGGRATRRASGWTQPLPWSVVGREGLAPPHRRLRPPAHGVAPGAVAPPRRALADGDAVAAAQDPEGPDDDLGEDEDEDEDEDDMDGGGRERRHVTCLAYDEPFVLLGRSDNVVDVFELSGTAFERDDDDDEGFHRGEVHDYQDVGYGGIHGDIGSVDAGRGASGAPVGPAQRRAHARRDEARAARRRRPTLRLEHRGNLVGHTGSVACVSSSYGRCVSGGNDGCVMVWRLEQGPRRAAAAAAAAAASASAANSAAFDGRTNVVVGERPLLVLRAEARKGSVAGLGGAAGAETRTWPPSPPFTPPTLGELARSLRKAKRRDGIGAPTGSIEEDGDGHGDEDEASTRLALDLPSLSSPGAPPRVRWVTTAFDRILSVVTPPPDDDDDAVDVAESGQGQGDDVGEHGPRHGLSDVPWSGSATKPTTTSQPRSVASASRTARRTLAAASPAHRTAPADESLQIWDFSA